MIRAHQWHNDAWRPVWIMEFITAKNCFDGVAAVLAIPASQDGGHGSTKGMKVEVEKSLSQLRIARTRIPLHD